MICTTIPRNQKTPQEGVFFDLCLVRYERKQSHKSSSLYCFSKCALIFCSEASSLSRIDSCVWVKEFLQTINIFVVDMMNTIRIKIILFHTFYILERYIFKVNFFFRIFNRIKIRFCLRLWGFII